MKAGAQNVSLVIPDLVKGYTKTTEKLMSSSSSQAADVDWQVKLQCVKGLILLVQNSFSFSMLAQYYDQI